MLGLSMYFVGAPHRAGSSPPVPVSFPPWQSRLMLGGLLYNDICAQGDKTRLWGCRGRSSSAEALSYVGRPVTFTVTVEAVDVARVGLAPLSHAAPAVAVAMLHVVTVTVRVRFSGLGL